MISRTRSLAVLLASLFFKRCHASLFCADWCIDPYCSCQDLVPGLRTFLNSMFRSSPVWLANCGTSTCSPGFSGNECRCPFSRTDIADDSLLFPDSLKGSLTVTKSSSDDGTLLVGTWTSAYEAASNDPSKFSSWLDGNNGGENIWSLAKTVSGNELIGSSNWIRLRKAGETSFQTVMTVGAQSGFVVVADQVFGGTFEGLYLSTDEGVQWTRVPTDCDAYNSTGATNPPTSVPKPDQGYKYCQEHVTHMHVLEDGSLLVFYFGYGGAHILQAGGDPHLSKSWVSLPSFQDTSFCQSLFCFAVDAAVFGDYLYVAFQTLPLLRIHRTQATTWEEVTIGMDSKGNHLQPTALATRNNSTQLYAATDFNGLYRSSDGKSWSRVSDSDCSNRNTPPSMSGGMVDFPYASIGSNVLVFGTVHGPWIFRE